MCVFDKQMHLLIRQVGANLHEGKFLCQNFLLLGLKVRDETNVTTVTLHFFLIIF